MIRYSQEQLKFGCFEIKNDVFDFLAELNLSTPIY